MLDMDSGCGRAGIATRIGVWPCPVDRNLNTFELAYRIVTQQSIAKP